MLVFYENQKVVKVSNVSTCKVRQVLNIAREMKHSEKCRICFQNVWDHIAVQIVDVRNASF